MSAIYFKNPFPLTYYKSVWLLSLTQNRRPIETLQFQQDFLVHCSCSLGQVHNHTWGVSVQEVKELVCVFIMLKPTWI